MFNTGRYVQCLFWAHLVVEKLSKAHWVQDNVDDYPPCIYNIVRLWQNTTLQPTGAQEKVALDLNQFQLEGRYPDYSRTLVKHVDIEPPTFSPAQFTDWNPFVQEIKRIGIVIGEWEPVATHNGIIRL
ncbi:HEPN domain-containing protein [Hymenobacter sp. BRD67]|uniref:HEPN domain-containing protein n=1 Tax=Hymenobacter sp. BRD67 TaxID=2675877 RepID=UPI0020B71981|nr:HEPN domain-containing protein [Hymenobacter sp. BRD67]